MKYGFVIDNRKCIGCHACTTACKAEHDVPIGVNRTWVKQVEKGEFPNTRRVFSVLRCNHCTDAPCVEICPVEALFIRDDGIVDFDKRRCIGCKSCMQACPYDALYIDPGTHTAAKCNYCAHRIDLGLEPACVNVCPEHAIISGDMDDPESEIAQLLGREVVTVRKQEKGTAPNVFYINGDETSLTPDLTAKSSSYLWSAQTRGVGHYARAAEKLAWSNADVVQELLAQQQPEEPQRPVKSVDVLMQNKVAPLRAYDVPDKGILWGWEVPAYVVTKAVAAGVFLVFMLMFLSGLSDDVSAMWSIGAALLFLVLTGALLVKDLDRPDRFVYVLLRPQWRSWLTRGGYAITVFGGLLTLQLIALYFEWQPVSDVTAWINIPVAFLVAMYTAFLFGQAKGRDFWQNPTLPWHMIVHSIMAGAAAVVFMQALSLVQIYMPWLPVWILLCSIVANLAIAFVEFSMKHVTTDAATTAEMIFRGRYALMFWGGVVVFGNLIPLVLIWLAPAGVLHAIAALLVLFGIYLMEKIWIEAPQRIPLA